MTNSCVSSKWLPHIQTGNYGMSQNCIDESKQFIFVKLTDSAYRAVEEYQKNETKCSARAKIQVIGNGGVISFPTADDSEGQKFGFAIDDIEGSFECIKQTQNDLDVLGTLPYKMRIQANDDVYEKTRHRMAVAEETQKNKCTREIKPNQTDIGRKVKLKNSIGSGGGGGRESGSNNNGNISNSGSGNGSRNGISGGINSSSSVLPKRDLISSNCSPIASIVNNSSSSSINSHPLKTSSNSRSPNPSMSSSRSSNNNNNSQNNSNLVGMPTSASSLSSALSSAAGSGTSGINNGYFRGNSPEMKTNSNNKNGPNLAGNNRTKGKTLGSGNGPGIGMNSNNNRHKGNDITKRNIRERLIHLLALKPFKKPELYSRLQNEGIRDREKSLISTILKEISTMRDNTYNLKRPMWNDVNENWQFYTEQELQMLKRRKPQNLTPPISSDAGSSTSGQSPTSTHNGSPPPAVKRPPSLDHRDRCYEDPMSKKPRISHFKKDTNSSSNSASTVLLGPIVGTDKNQNPMNNQNHIDADENSVDLSYSVLDNDEFMMGGVGNSRRSAGGGGVSTASGGLKIYHNNNNKSPFSEAAVPAKNLSPFNSTSGGGNSRQQNKSPSTLNSSSSSNNNSNKQSVIYSPSQQQQQQHQQQQQQQQQTLTAPASNHHSGIYGHKSQQQQQQHQQQSQYQHLNQQQKQPPLHYQQPPQQQQQPLPPPQQLPRQQQHHQRHTQQQQHQQQQQQQQALPPPPPPPQQQPKQTQSQSQQPSYDFSKYTKITTIEQRRHYKTEFENDYAEYRQLLSQIDNVGQRFQMLATRLCSARNHADYSNIKKQIVNEYEMIRNEKAHQRDKMRFDYLHEKLAHIKGLVSDYDKMLTAQAATQQQTSTSGSPDPAAVAPAQQHLSNGTEPSSGYFPRSKLYMTPSPPQRIDGSGGVAGGGNGGRGLSGGATSGVMENGPAIHHQQSRHMMPNDDDAY